MLFKKPMKILLWNCCNGLASEEKTSLIRNLKPDLAIIPEIREADIEKVQPSSSIWVTNNHTGKRPKGLGVLAFNGGLLKLEARDEEMEIFLPVRVHFENFEFNLLAVWNFYSACKQGRFKGVKTGDSVLEFEAIRYYEKFLKGPALMAGDWNLGPTFAQKDWLRIVELLAPIGLRSLYHQFTVTPLHETKVATFRSNKGKHPHHLDHFFGTNEFIESGALEILPIQAKSDHAPVVLSFEHRNCP